MLMGFEFSALVAAAAWLILVVHELGHLLTARYFGVRVLAISLGLGPEIVGFFDRHGTHWSFGVIPCGSYLKMAGENGASIAPGAVGSEFGPLSSLLRIKRAVIYGAGPVANIVLAPIMYALAQLCLVGQVIWPRAGDPASTMALIIGLSSLSIGLLCLLPLPHHDGGNIIKCIKWFYDANIRAPRSPTNRVKSREDGQLQSLASLRRLSLRADGNDTASPMPLPIEVDAQKETAAS